MGEVLLARDELLNRLVALKRLRPDGQDAALRRRAILKEARRASQINDRRIAAIHDVLEADDDVLLVMEYVDGVTLRQRMTEPVPLEAFWSIAIPCAEAIAAAHAHGVIHRDIKPENLILTPDGQVKILDFGIAQRYRTADDRPPAETSTTGDATVIAAGTPRYMAPEAHYGGRVDQRTDLFSLGVVFYELLTGKPPFDGATYAEVVHAVMNTDPPPVVDLRPEAESALSNVVTRLLAKDPADRLATSGELVRQLVEARAGSAPHASELLPDAAPREESGSPPRVRARAAAILPLAAAAAAVIAWAGWSLSHAPLPSDRHFAVLAPQTPDAGEEFASFALGSMELVSNRLQRYVDTPGVQEVPFQEGYAEHVRTPGDARRALGARLALVSTLAQRADAFVARLELRETGHERLVAARAFRVPLSQPFALHDRLYREATAMLGLGTPGSDTRSECGIDGAGTLRFLLQGRGRMRAATSQDEARKAVEDLETACRAEPGASAPRAALAAAELKTRILGGDPSWQVRAEASARDAIALDGTRAEAHHTLGLVLAAERRPRESLAELQRAVELDPHDDDLRFKLGRTYGRLGDHDRERAVYQATAERRPHDWQPYWWLATWHFREGHVEEAIAAYREMVSRAPLLHKGYSSLGGALVLRGDYAAAIDTLKRSLELQPTKTAFENLGSAYFNSGRADEAIEAYNQSLQFGIAGYAAWLNLGDAYFWLRHARGEAEEAYREAVVLGREDMRARVRLGRSADVMIPANLATVFPKLGQPDSARTYLAEALRADSTNSNVEYCAALTYWQLQDRSRALTWLERSVHGGFPVVWLRDSPIFKEWREAAAFRALVGETGHEARPAGSRKGGARR